VSRNLEANVRGDAECREPLRRPCPSMVWLAVSSACLARESAAVLREDRLVPEGWCPGGSHTLHPCLHQGAGPCSKA